MKTTAAIFGLLSDPSRLRILLLLDKRELCVCQMMGVLGMSQPLVSRNLSLLRRAGFLEARREGKMTFYRLKETLPSPLTPLVGLLRTGLAGDETHERDLKSLWDCTEFQKRTGKCGMETFLAFLERKKKGRTP